MSQNESITPQRRAKHPRTGLAGPYGHPLHPIMVTIPIGAWVASLIFDLANLFGNEHESFSRGAIWLIAIGVIGALLAAILGFLDFSTLTAGTVAHRTALIHMSINLTVVVLFVIGFIIRVNSDYDRLSIPGFIISIVALHHAHRSPDGSAASSPTATACASPTSRPRRRDSVRRRDERGDHRCLRRTPGCRQVS